MTMSTYIYIIRPSPHSLLTSLAVSSHHSHTPYHVVVLGVALTPLSKFLFRYIACFEEVGILLNKEEKNTKYIS